MQEFETQLTIRQEWRDLRLKFDSGPEGPEFIRIASYQRIWRPDSFFAVNMFTRI